MFLSYLGYTTKLVHRFLTAVLAPILKANKTHFKFQLGRTISELCDSHNLSLLNLLPHL